MNRSLLTAVALPLASLSLLLSAACAAPTGSDDATSSESAVNQGEGIRITFKGCVPDFSGKGTSTGTLPHDGIDKCSQDDGRYNTGAGYRLDLLRGGSGSDASRTITGASWFEDRADAVLSISAEQLAAAEGLKVWFGGHSSWLPVAQIPSGTEVTCAVKLVGRWVAADKAYAKHAELDCKGGAPSGGALSVGKACESTSQCKSGLTCGVTFACIDGCLGSGQPKDAAEACAKACPDVCRPELTL